tara:strand:+ start:944 stop:2179 length:1236 start_codon:yes stop_codon:yes gene_type:complete
MFENEANNFIVDSILNYFHEYKSAPSLEVMKVKVSEIENDLLKKTVVESLKESWLYVNSDDLDFIKEQAITFFKNQNIKKAIIESVELLKVNDFDRIKGKIDGALKAGTERNVGHEYKDDIEERYKDSVRNVVKTGWDVIDDIADGGLGKGELGVFVAPAGIGKSWALVNVGANAAKAGLNVIHYTLELNEAYVGLRYDSVMTGISAQDLKYSIDEVKKLVGKMDGNLIIKQYPTKSASVSSIGAHIEKCKMQGMKPDMVIVDYADLLRDISGGREVRHMLGNIYEDLRGLAGEHDIPVWTASQANRSALEEDIIGAEKIAESYAKIMTADFVVSLSRKIEDKLAGTGRWHVIKNRFGPDGITFPSKANMSNGQMQIFESNSVQGQETQKDMNNHSEYLRKMLKNKYKELE